MFSTLPRCWLIVRGLTYIWAAININLFGCCCLCFQYKPLKANLSDWEMDICSCYQWYFPSRRISPLSCWANQEIHCCGLLVRFQALLFSLSFSLHRLMLCSPGPLLKLWLNSLLLGTVRIYNHNYLQLLNKRNAHCAAVYSYFTCTQEMFL